MPGDHRRFSRTRRGRCLLGNDQRTLASIHLWILSACSVVAADCLLCDDVRGAGARAVRGFRAQGRVFGGNRRPVDGGGSGCHGRKFDPRAGACGVGGRIDLYRLFAAIAVAVGQHPVSVCLDLHALGRVVLGTGGCADGVWHTGAVLPGFEPGDRRDDGDSNRVHCRLFMVDSCGVAVDRRIASRVADRNRARRLGSVWRLFAGLRDWGLVDCGLFADRHSAGAWPPVRLSRSSCSGAGRSGHRWLR